jgi:starch phosphorylase
MDGLMYHDPYMLFADFQSYVECQAKVADAYVDTEHWTRMSILNTARSGKFSSDRTIQEYCEGIWHTKPVPIQMLTHSEAGSA